MVGLRFCHCQEKGTVMELTLIVNFIGKEKYFFGKTTLKEVHVSSREEFEAPDGQRMARKLFN